MAETRWLALDASGPGASVAMVQEEAGRTTVLGAVDWHQARSAGSHLIRWVDDLVTAFGPPQAIAVGIGPGSFTGVRVAVTAAKTLAWAWHVPLYAVSSLAARAALVDTPNRVVVASSERRRDLVYLGVYRRTAAGVETLRPDAPWRLPDRPEEVRWEEAVAVVGPLADDQEWLGRLHPQVVPVACHGLARGVVTAAAMPGRRPVDPLGLVPAYLREPAVTVREEVSHGAP
jgi:tRNA threonylcarbamoyladenosine biosynthesis protein TsaB